jgi:hypothetical protein
MSKGKKYLELLDFVKKIAGFSCECEDDMRECISCPAAQLLDKITYRKDSPVDTGE